MTSTIDPHRLEALASLCAIGAATSEEVVELNALRAQYPAAESEAMAFEEVAAAMATSLSPVAPPPQALDVIRSRIELQGLSGSTPQASGQVVDLQQRRHKGRRWVAAAAGFAAAATLVLGVLLVRERGISESLRAEMADVKQTGYQQLAGERKRVAELQGQLAANRQRLQYINAPTVQLATLTQQQPNGPRVNIFIDPENRRWLVLGYDLPDIDPNRQDYQLWFIPRIQGGQPIPAGLLKSRSDGVFEADIAVPERLDIGHAAISLEKKGGVKVPTDVKMIGPLL